MTDFGRPFGPDDLPGEGESAADIARALAAGRELDALAVRDDAAPSGDFVDRVMTAIEAEPTPRPVTAAGRAVREGRLAAALAGFVDAWRVAFTGGRPIAVRAQALALVLVAIVAVGALGGAAAVGALGLLDRPSPSETVPPPSASPSPTVAPSPSPSPTPSPSATESVEPSPSPSATETTGPIGTRTPEPTEPDDSGEPDETDKPDDTPEPDETPDETDDSGHSGD